MGCLWWRVYLWLRGLLQVGCNLWKNFLAAGFNHALFRSSTSRSSCICRPRVTRLGIPSAWGSRSIVSFSLRLFPPGCLDSVGRVERCMFILFMARVFYNVPML